MKSDFEQHSPKPKVEILDDQGLKQEEVRAFADFIARLLDTIIRIPGTPIRIGLDPLLGVIPVLGDIIANLIGSTILLLAIQLEVPKVVILRMAAHIGLNTLIGAIPGLGDLFSIWYRSNVKNAALLRRYTNRPTSRATFGDWMFVSVLILLILALSLGILALFFFALQWIWEMFQ